MRKNISGTKMLQKKLFNGECRSTPSEIDHYRNICNFSCFNGSVSRCPVMAFKMCQFNPDNISFVIQSKFPGYLRIHIFEILFKRIPSHTFAHNIQKCQHPGLRFVNCLPFECRECSPSCTSGIYHCCNTHPECKSIWCY